MTTKTDTDINNQIKTLEEKIQQSRKELTELRKKAANEEIRDYTLYEPDGSTVQLSKLFADNDDLIVVHNMGRGCAYCTLWADGFNGMYKHLENRAGFVLISHDDPVTLKEFSESRNWGFRMLSNNGGDFTRDMGYENDKGQPQPGVSTFSRDSEGKIYRIAHTWFGPGDDFCSLWHILDLLKDGSNNWAPKFHY